MNNELLFDLKSPPSEEFDTAQELLRYCKIIPNRMAVHWQPKIPKERKIGENITIKFDF